METATGITLLFVAGTSALTSWARLNYLRRGGWTAAAGVAIGVGMTVWCTIAGLWWLY